MRYISFRDQIAGILTDTSTMLRTILCALITMPCLHASFPHVYSVEHLKDVLGSPENPSIADKHGVLAMYGPECEDQLNPRDMHMGKHLVYLTHDYVRVREHIWYNYPESDDPYKKYGKFRAPCLSAYYFKNGTSLDRPTQVWTSEMEASLSTWVWELMNTTITVRNTLKENIRIVQYTQSNKGPHLEGEIVEAGHSRKLIAFVSYNLFALDETGDVPKHVMVVNHDTKEVIIKKSSVAKLDKNAVMKPNLESEKHWRDWIWSHADRHLRNLKQPLIVHSYTDTGYRKMKMPEPLYRNLVNFYHRKKEKRTQEALSTSDGVIQSNSKGSPTTMVQLPEDDKTLIGNVMKPIMEEWCKCKLEKIAVYGIREYYKDNILRNHVDQVETHVISAILQIHQDLGEDGDDWLLEVIRYDGKREQIELKAGEMLLYESAKLIHGRPKAFKGDIYANAFLHYKPVSGWEYSFDNSRHSFVNPAVQILEPLDRLYTDLTKRKRLIVGEDELPGKDEL